MLDQEIVQLKLKDLQEIPVTVIRKRLNDIAFSGKIAKIEAEVFQQFSIPLD